MYFSIDKLSAIKQNVNSNTSKTNIPNSSRKEFSVRNVKTEINLLGQTVEEAIFLIDKFLDDAAISALSSVRIIYG